MLLLEILINCITLAIAILKWIAYIKTLNLILIHIIGKENLVGDMLSRARYIFEEEMMTHERSEDQEEKSYNFFFFTFDRINFSDKIQNFYEGLYEGKLKDSRIYLSIIKK